MDRQIDFKDQVFTVPEAAKHLRVSRSLLYKKIKAGELKPSKFSARTLITGAEISRVLKSNG